MPNTKSNKPKPISTADFDAKFDAGEDISQHLDFSSMRVVKPETGAQKVNVDFPIWVVDALDSEAERIGIARQALIKLWIVERLEGNRRVIRNEEGIQSRVIIDAVTYKEDASAAEILPQRKKSAHTKGAKSATLEKRV